MSNTTNFNSNTPYISAGIDVGSEVSWMSMVLPDREFINKPYKIVHADMDSLNTAVSHLKEAEEQYSLKVHVFLESTGIYHLPLFCYFKDRDFNCSVINPIITNNSTNFNIRKVHNDKYDSKKIALVGLNPNLKVSNIPTELIYDCRNLCRSYYKLVDLRTGFINRLKKELRVSFPGYIKVFSKITTETSLVLLETYTSPRAFLEADKQDIINIIRSTARFGQNYAEKKYSAIIQAAKDAMKFGCSYESCFVNIKLYIRIIRIYNEEIKNLLDSIHELIEAHEDTDFVKQIHLIETFKGAGFISAVTLMSEIGDFSAFSKPKQLLAYFGLDPSVNQSGKFEGTNNRMSKRGSAIGRRVIHTLTLKSISRSRTGEALNPVLYEYYQKKCESSKKLVAMGAVSHKVCNIIFAMLRDNKPFEIIDPEEHIRRYNILKNKAA